MTNKKVRIRYDESEDGYALVFMNEKHKEWALSTVFKCRETNNEYIHYSIINELNKWIDLGYTYSIY